ncbi:small multi-drug export protein [Photobacterium sp. CCB-ST2H9]|uniref:small multi-drug export protein n=1 Tax=Photobacterium sp. CCB-ST2H9 TaxID=2912855 RepID=UPI0020066CED|nr:small multi-drug export protein [Photobacterium sp. CCB-ST2H9]UTM59270.1 small multi-drug export protein [Photobacterium sp. CCB-ST2H9]
MMNELEKAKQKYQRVQFRLNNDPSLDNWEDRYKSCRDIYIKQVKNEPAIMEWEVDYWGRFGQWGLPFLILFGYVFLPLFPMYWFAKDVEDIINVILVCFLVVSLPILIIVLGAEWFPTRYYQKITASGFYSYGVKVGSEKRQKMAKYCMMGGFVIAVILLFVAGPMVFAGAGAASLSFLKLGSIPEPEPEESAWPWLGIYSLVMLKKPFLYHLYKVSTHGENYLILTKDQLVQIQNILEKYGQHEVDILDKKEGIYYSRWWEHQETMPFRRVKIPSHQLPTTKK